MERKTPKKEQQTARICANWASQKGQQTAETAQLNLQRVKFLYTDDFSCSPWKWNSQENANKICFLCEFVCWIVVFFYPLRRQVVSTQLQFKTIDSTWIWTILSIFIVFDVSHALEDSSQYPQCSLACDIARWTWMISWWANGHRWWKVCFFCFVISFPFYDGVELVAALVFVVSLPLMMVLSRTNGLRKIQTSHKLRRKSHFWDNVLWTSTI